MIIGMIGEKQRRDRYVVVVKMREKRRARERKKDIGSECVSV